jgi:hypothetical protein
MAVLLSPGILIARLMLQRHGDRLCVPADREQQFLGTVDAGFAAGLAFVLAGVGLNAKRVGTAADAKARIVQARTARLDGRDDAVGRDGLVDVDAVDGHEGLRKSS